MPAVNTDLMYQAMLKLGGKPNQIVYWSGLLDWRNQTLTPNPDVIYLMAFFNTKDGPVVIEIPPADDGVINGSIMDPLAGGAGGRRPGQRRQGPGGKYVITPPGYQGAVPDGYIVLPSGNYLGYALLRSILKSGSDADVKTAVAYGKRIKLYPLGQAANPPENGVRRCARGDLRFDHPLRRRILPVARPLRAAEPWLVRDKAMIDPLKSIGIEKAKPFSPDEATKGILNAAAREARAWLDLKYETMFVPYYEGRRWVFPVSPEVIGGLRTRVCRIRTAIPSRAAASPTRWRSSAPSMSGIGQYYLMTLKDKDGQSLAGANTYRLTVPGNARRQAILVGDRLRPRDPCADTRDAPRGAFFAKSGSAGVNADGSVDIWFGPKAPAGKENELGADQRERTVRGAVSVLRSRETGIRQDLATAGRRADGHSMRRVP